MDIGHQHTQCAICHEYLTVTVWYFPQASFDLLGHHAGPTLTKEMPAFEALCLPANERIVERWCKQCGVLYKTGPQ